MKGDIHVCWATRKLFTTSEAYKVAYRSKRGLFYLEALYPVGLTPGVEAAGGWEENEFIEQT